MVAITKVPLFYYYHSHATEGPNSTASLEFQAVALKVSARNLLLIVLNEPWMCVRQFWYSTPLLHRHNKYWSSRTGTRAEVLGGKKELKREGKATTCCD